MKTVFPLQAARHSSTDFDGGGVVGEGKTIWAAGRAEMRDLSRGKSTASPAVAQIIAKAVAASGRNDFESSISSF